MRHKFLKKLIFISFVITLQLGCSSSDNDNMESDDEFIISRNQIYSKNSIAENVVDVFRIPSEAEPKPGIIFIHGGAWVSGDKSEFEDLCRGYARVGYVTFCANYRLVKPDGRDRFPAQLQDMQELLKWIGSNAGELGVNQNRIGVWGGSAGGYLASMLGTGVSDITGIKDKNSSIRCVVNLSGPTDLSKEFPAFPLDSPSLIRQFLNGYSPVLASPISRITSSTKPFLLIHGTADDIVPVEQSHSFHLALQVKDVESRLLEFTGAKHAITDANQIIEMLTVATDFLDRHLKQ